MGRRRQAREMALQALYLADAATIDADEAYRIVSVGSKLDAKSEAFARDLVLGVSAGQKTLDRHIQEIAENWDLARMALVDRNLLRLASHEILNCLETPVSVIIDEALEIAKAYSSEDSSKFINGILDKIKTHRPVPASDA